jgi:hypothetical protein
MFIHDSLDTGALVSILTPLHYMYDLTCPQILADPLLPLRNMVIGSSSPFHIKLCDGCH